MEQGNAVKALSASAVQEQNKSRIEAECEVFAVGKMLAGFVLLLLGNVRALLVQVAVMAAACAWYVVEPRSAQMYGWILFRVVSGMASTTMLPFVGAWFPRKWYGRVFALLFAGFQAGYLVCSYYWGHLLSRGKLHWKVPLRL